MQARTRLTEVERLRDEARDEAREVGRQHAETLAALSDLITIQKRSDTERGSLEISLREQQTAISRHEVWLTSVTLTQPQNGTAGALLLRLTRRECINTHPRNPPPSSSRPCSEWTSAATTSILR